MTRMKWPNRGGGVGWDWSSPTGASVRRRPSNTEREPRTVDTLTCFHDNSYTMPCKACRRTKQEAKKNLDALRKKIAGWRQDLSPM